MNTSMVELRPELEREIRELFSFKLADRDMQWAANWFMELGVLAVHAGLRNHPELTLGDLVRISFGLKAAKAHAAGGQA